MKENKRNKLLFLVISTITYIIILVIPTLSFSKISTIMPEKILYEKKYNFNSVIIRDEVIQFDDGEIAKLEKLIPENKKVSKGSHIATVATAGGQNHEIYSNCSGFVSYHIDGLENIDIDVIKKMKDSDFDYLFDEETYQNSQGIKIIDSYMWYLIVDVDDNIYDTYMENDTIRIQIDDGVNKYIDTYLIAKLKTENHSILVLESDNFIHDFLNFRKLDINIINTQEEVYKIPNTALTQKDGINGVFIKEHYGVVGFRPVEVIDSDDYFIYVNLGDKNGDIIVNEENKKTIDRYSEIILEPQSVEYGSIIN